MPEQLRVMISSTARDLPEHRQKVMDACMRLGMFYPDMMEHLTATDANALEVSLNIADRADLYVGVFAFRYGYVPDDQTISVTESEYNRASERKIPRLIFLMGDEHAIKPGDVETGDGAAKLTKLKGRLKKERVVGFFDTADDLKAQVIQALVPHRESDVTKFHYVSDIPTPPEQYIAHPYTLLQTHKLIGRQAELKLLTDWITGKDLEFDGRKAVANSVRIMSVIAIGGMGKSALTWKWFNEIAPEEMKSLDGRMWWGFYESDATFENFVTRALSYVTQRPLEEVQKIPAPDRESQLLAALDREPFLIVLDGLERILIAYARMDAARLDDSEVGKEKGLRKTADPRAGNFFKKLAQVKSSRILVSSRLYPTELETETRDPIRGAFRLQIEGLTDEDAVELWRAFGASGSRGDLLSVFNTFGKHSLLIQALAGEVKRYRKAPGNFETWRKANPRFDPAKFPDLTKAMGHVLEFALRGLSDKARRVLCVIAAFRMPASYDTLIALLVGRSKTRFELKTGNLIKEEGKLFDSEKDLDTVLEELEDRGLLGWDKRANRYDLHPIVRSVLWGSLREDKRLGVYEGMLSHFASLPTVAPYEVNSLDDLTPAIELFNALVGLSRYREALALFGNRLVPLSGFLGSLSVNSKAIELLESIPPSGLPILGGKALSGYWFLLAQGYRYMGQPNRAVALYSSPILMLEKFPVPSGGSAFPLVFLSEALSLSGALRQSEAFGCRAIRLARDEHGVVESLALVCLGHNLAARGRIPESHRALQRGLKMANQADDQYGKLILISAMSKNALWLGDAASGRRLGDQAWELAQTNRVERDSIAAARLQGEAALGLNDFVTGDERLQLGLTRARMVNLVEEELPTLVALAELRRQQGILNAAREYLNDIWEMAERGPYPIIHADAFNVLAQIERDAGNTPAAIEAATKAYRLAWCDGPPFAYHWGLEKAKQHLKELGAPEPEMPPFDESKFEPMPEVEIDPEDEFHVGTQSGQKPDR